MLFIAHSMNYWLKNKYKDLIAFIFIVLAVYLFFLKDTIYIVFGIILIFVSAKISEDQVRSFFRNLVLIFFAIVYLIATISWLFRTEIDFFGFKQIIDNSQMMVLITILYVFFTYLILNKSKEQFDISRLPLLKVVNDEYCFKFLNLSDYPAKRVITYIKIIYPIPKNIGEKIKFYFSSMFKTHIYKIPVIFPHEEEHVDFREDAMKILKLQKERKETKHFKVSLSFTYESDTGYLTPKTIKEEYSFEIHPSAGYPTRSYDKGNPEYKAIKIK